MDFEYSHDTFAVDRDDIIAKISQDKRVLHVGAADSPYTREKLINGLLLHERLAAVANVLTGIDVDPAGIELIESAGLPIVELIDLNEAPATLGSDFDVVVFGETIEHLTNLGNALETLKGCMNPETRLVISTPNLFSLSCFRMAFTGREHVHDDHKVGFSHGLLVQLLESAGFEVERTYFTFLPRKEQGRRKQAWLKLTRLRPGFAETLLSVCRLSRIGDSTIDPTLGRGAKGGQDADV